MFASLREAAGGVLHQHVGQQQRERLVADDVTRAPHRVAEAERRLLAREAGLACGGQVARELFELGVLVALAQRGVELVVQVEVILDHALAAAGDEDEVLDSCFARLVDHVLDQRPVDHRQHLLRHRLGGREEPGAEAGHRENRFADRFHGNVARGGTSDGRTLSGKKGESKAVFTIGDPDMNQRLARRFAPIRTRVKHTVTTSGPLMARARPRRWRGITDSQA